MKPTSPSEIIRNLYFYKGFRTSAIFLDKREVRICLRRTGKTSICPVCESHCRKVEIESERIVRDLNIADRVVKVMFTERKVVCKCGYRGVEFLEFIDKYSRYTKRFEEYVAMLCEKMTNTDVAKMCHIDWKSVKDIDKKNLALQRVGLDSISPTGIGIDEVAYEKGHKYFTIVRELEHNRVIWIGIGRKKEDLDQFFKELGPSKSAKITIATMDMWDAFIASVRENCPNAEIVFDKFHVSKKVNEALDAVRKKEFGKGDMKLRKVMKKKRFVILKRRKTLNNEEKETIEALKEKNDPLYTAYLLKEQVLDIFDERSRKLAATRFETWFANVASSGVTQFDPVVTMIKTYFYGIMNYFKHHVTNAGAEGINNKINVIKRKAFGYRDLEYFMLKILQSCGWRTP
jgi:transposase